MFKRLMYIDKVERVRTVYIDRHMLHKDCVHLHDVSLSGTLRLLPQRRNLQRVDLSRKLHARRDPSNRASEVTHTVYMYTGRVAITHCRAGLGPPVAALGRLFSPRMYHLFSVDHLFSTLYRDLGPPEIFGWWPP